MVRGSLSADRVFPTLLLLCIAVISGCQDDPKTHLPTALDIDELAEPDPRQLLAELTTFIKTRTDYSFEALVTYQSMQENGQALSFDLSQRLVVSQPDRLYWETIEDDAQIRRVWFSDGVFTMLKLPDGIYGQLAAPATIPEMIDLVTTEYGIVVPFSDLLASQRAPVLLRGIEDSDYVGPSWVGGVWTHHLAFRNPLVDFEVWIPMEGDPVLSKLAISWKLEQGNPRYVARFRSWDFSASIPDSRFRFAAPEDAERIEIFPASARLEGGS